MICSLIWAMGIVAVAAAPALSAIDFAVTDVGGGDVLTLTGTALATLTSVEFSRDSGTTWVAGTLGALTATTAKVSPPAMAASSNGLVRVIGPGGTSNALPLEFWSPNQITGVDGYFDSRKGIVLGTGANVAQWVEQSRSAPYLSNGVTYAQKVDNVFAGTKPSVRFTQTSPLYIVGARRQLGSGSQSFFWVGKWTQNDTAQFYQGNAPGTVIGDTTNSIINSVGINGGTLEASVYSSNGWEKVNRGASLNDGTTRLVGYTYSGAVQKAYVGSTQVGADGAALATYNTGRGWNSIGAGYKDGSQVEDGFAGDLGAAVIVNGLISAGDLAKLYTWSRAGFGTA